MTRKQFERYLRNGTGCPFCLSPTVQPVAYEREGLDVREYETCPECGANFCSSFILTEVERVKDNEMSQLKATVGRLDCPGNQTS